MYNAAMKKGRLKEEDVAKISITANRAEDLEVINILKKLLAKKKRKVTN
jgi:hypothetical protein